MKKIFFLLAILPMFLFIACSKENEGSVSLNGTTWINSDDGDGERILKFSETEFYYTLIYKGKTEDSDNGTYTYTPPFVNFTAINYETHKVETISGRIDNDKLIFGEIVYRKK